MLDIHETSDNDDDDSSLISGMSRREVAKSMGMSTTLVKAIELKFALRLYWYLADDPQTQKFLRHPPTTEPEP